MTAPSHFRATRDGSSLRRVTNRTAPIPVGLRVERVPPARWPAITDWDETVAASPRPSVFLTRDWQTAWWSAFGAGLEPVLLRVAEDDGPTLGLAPLYLTRIPGARRLPLRRLGLMGDQVVGSEYLGLAARAGSERAVAVAVARHLSAGSLRWDVAELWGLREDDPAATALLEALAAGGGGVRQEREGCSMIPLPGDFETYLAGLNSTFRQRYRQRANKLRRAVGPRFFMTAGQEELDGHLDRLFAMHAERWALEGKPGVFVDPRMRAFYRDVAGRLLSSGRLRFWHLEAEGEIRASQFGFAHAGVLHSLQEAYDVGFKAPGVGGLGVVLRAHAIEAAIAEGLHGYDFLGGEEDFKTRWGTRTHHVRWAEVTGSGMRGQLGWLAAGGRRRLRARVGGAAPRPLKRALRHVAGRAS